jgi:hypothetical protein
MHLLQSTVFREFAAHGGDGSTVAAHFCVFVDEKRVYDGEEFNMLRFAFLCDQQRSAYEITGVKESDIPTDVLMRDVVAPFVESLEKGITYTLLDGRQLTAYGTVYTFTLDMKCQQHLL